MGAVIAQQRAKFSGGVGLHRIEGEAVAGDENVIDVVSGLPAVAGRTAGAERRGEDRAQLLLALASRPPAHEAEGLPRHILQARTGAPAACGTEAGHS